MRKIALVGTSATSVYAPFDEPEWEIWGVSARAAHVTRADRWFELHRLDGEPPGWAAAWRATVKKFIDEVDLYMIYPEDLGPNVKEYPVHHIMGRFDSYFLTSSFSWMMAMAIDELRPLNGEPEEDATIGIWGVEMEGGTEYAEQRAGFKYFISLAQFLGIKIVMLASGGLAYQQLPYPMWQDDPLRSKLVQRMGTSKNTISELKAELENNQKLIAANHAQEHQINRSKEDGYDPDADLKALSKERVALMKEAANIARNKVAMEGMLEEQEWFWNYLKAS